MPDTPLDESHPMHPNNFQGQTPYAGGAVETWIPTEIIFLLLLLVVAGLVWIGAKLMAMDHGMKKKKDKKEGKKGKKKR